MAGETLFLVRAPLMADIQRAIRWQKNFSVTGATFKNSPDAASLIIPPPPSPPPAYQNPQIWVVVTGKAAGFGKYTGKPLHPGTTAITTEDGLTAADIGDIDADDDELLLLNVREKGKETWDLWDGASAGDNSTLNPTEFLGTIWGTTDEGVTTVLIDGWKSSDCPAPE